MTKQLVFYDSGIAKEIIDTISTTATGLKRLCAANPHWPDKSNIYRWCLDHPEFRDQYLRARAIQMDWLAEEALEIAFNDQYDTISTEKGDFCNHEWINRSRLKVDTIKWMTAKLAPKTYGDKVQLETIDKNKIDPALQLARETVLQLKADDHGRSTPKTEN